MRHADQPPVTSVAPRVIGAGQHLGAAGGAVDQPRAAMATDVGEGPRLAIVAANDEHAFAEIFERPPLAPLRDLTLVTDHLRRGTPERLLLRLEEFRVEIEPAGKAPVVQRVDSGLD